MPRLPSTVSRSKGDLKADPEPPLSCRDLPRLVPNAQRQSMNKQSQRQQGLNRQNSIGTRKRASQISADPCRQQGERVREEITSNIVGSESKVRQWGPWPAGPVRPSGPCSFGVAKAPFVKLTASFLVGSESNVRQWGPWPAGPVRPSGPCSFGVAKAPFVKLLATGRQLRQLVFL